MKLSSALQNSPVLVVDDSPVDRAIAMGLLTQHGATRVLQACNGVEALELIERECPALVVTDIQMPEMNGLDLVSEVRQRYPHVPVVLITSQGSEELAVKAIRRGAASYVPKRILADELPGTVLQVLTASDNEAAQRSIDRFRVSTDVRYRIRNDVDLIAPLVSRMQESVARQFVVDDLEMTQVGIALSEALRNAIDHGNLELDSQLRCDGYGEYYRLAEFRRVRDPWRQRRVHIGIVELPTEVQFSIRDEGPGFDQSKLDYDPRDEENLARPCGRGLFLIREFMDDVRFNDLGNEITLIRRWGDRRNNGDDSLSRADGLNGKFMPSSCS